jgi:quercetin dioxygenase-like cupin family protein
LDLIKSLNENAGVHPEKFFKNTLFRSDALLVGLNCLEAGQVQTAHSHPDQDKFYYVVEGTGHFLLGEKHWLAAAGDIVWAPAGLSHGVENRGDKRLTLLIGIAPSP